MDPKLIDNLTVDAVAKVGVNIEEKTFNSWHVKSSQSHILHSKCSKETECAATDVDQCSFCIFNRQISLPHLPDMVFPNNILSLSHASGCSIQFNALDALKRVGDKDRKPSQLEISCSSSWKESRMDSGHMDKVKAFDWTFTSDYAGSLSGDFLVTQTDERINLDKLRQKEQILFYQDLTLFEDELHDNGIAVCNVKIRVMPSSFFILLRYFLRVDNVLSRINDTRFYHEFGTDFVLREFTSKEAKHDDLKIPTALLTEPSEVAEILPLVNSSFEKLAFPSTTDNKSA